MDHRRRRGLQRLDDQDRGAVNYHVLHADDRQGSWSCGPNHPAVYRSSVDGGTLTLSPIGADGCAGTKLIWSGDWSRG
jgi:hypothetical protein